MSGSKSGRTVTRPVTRFFCRWVPRRTTARKFSEEDAARVICYAIRDGGTRERIIARSEVRCPQGVQEGNRRQAEAIAVSENAVVQTAILAIGFAGRQNVDFINPLLEQLLTALGILVAFGLIIAAVPFVPPIVKRPVIIAVRQLETSLRVFEGRLIQQKAANDAFIDIMREIIRKAA